MKNIVLSLFIMAVLAPLHVSATLTVTPARTEFTAVQGSSATGSFSVKNEFPEAIDVTFETKNWFLLPQDKDCSIDDWLKVLSTGTHLLPGESADLQYQVSLSSHATGVRVGMISFVPQTANDQGLTMLISVSVYLTASGTEKVDWKWEKTAIQKDGDTLRVVVPISNHGNVHLRPTGWVNVLYKKQLVARLIFEEDRPIYPGRARPIFAKSQGPLPLKAGKYQAEVVVTAGNQEKKKIIRFKVTKSGSIKQ